jgi:hypothetical protein
MQVIRREQHLEAAVVCGMEVYELPAADGSVAWVAHRALQQEGGSRPGNRHLACAWHGVRSGFEAPGERGMQGQG